ncbi:GNAT family N-acetyltransferase [Mariniluteicoccus flavus]
MAEAGRPGVAAGDAGDAPPARIADAELLLLAHRAWLAADVRDIDGWLVRRDQGVTGRANSVLPLGEPADLAMALQLASALYRQKQIRPCFQISTSALPTGLDDELAERGWEEARHAYAMVAQTDEVVARAGERTRPVHVSGGLDDAHLDLWARIDGRDSGAGLAELAGVARRTPAVYASMRREGRVWATARGTLDDGWCGIDGLATDESARGRGLATDLIAEIARRASKAGARGMWLLVARDNPAQSLYERLGFTRQFAYHYRWAPTGK